MYLSYGPVTKKNRLPHDIPAYFGKFLSAPRLHLETGNEKECLEVQLRASPPTVRRAAGREHIFSFWKVRTDRTGLPSSNCHPVNQICLFVLFFFAISLFPSGSTPAVPAKGPALGAGYGIRIYGRQAIHFRAEISFKNEDFLTVFI